MQMSDYWCVQTLIVYSTRNHLCLWNMV